MYNMGKYVPNTIKIWKKDGLFKTKSKQRFICNVLSMCPTHASEKNKTVFRPP
jgi:hypothetical protein